MSERVAAIVLMGDPLRDPAAAVHHLALGSGPVTGRGSNGPGAGFGPLTPRVVEVCVAGDNVCNVPPAGRNGPVSPTHRHAYESPAASDAIAAAALP